MKRYLFAALVIGLAACGNKKTETAKNPNLLPTDLVENPSTASGTDTVAFERMPTMDFKDSVHDFGNIHEGEIVEYDFAFTNNGKTPLVIGNALGSCGCTVADFPKEPIQPGKGGVLKVKFNSAGKTGHQEKTVTINTNSQRGIQMLNIKAEVAENK